MKLKLSILIFAALSGVAFSCGKNLEEENLLPFIGKWELVKSYGGFNGTHTIPADVNKKLHIIMVEGKYMTFENDKKTSISNMKLSKVDPSLKELNGYYIMTLDKKHSYYLNFIKDTLVISPLVVDGYSGYFVKK
jgi:hypothetical protein